MKDMYGYFLLTIQTVMMGLAIVSFYCVIRIGGIVGVVGSIPGLDCFLALLVMFNRVATFHRDSSTVLRQWEAGSETRKSEWSKEVKSMRHLKFVIGSTYFIDKMSLLTICKIVFDGSVNTLLMSRSYS